MVLNRPFHCPVRCVQGVPFADASAELLRGRSYTLVTSTGWLGRGVLDTLTERCGPPAAMIADVSANPTVSFILENATQIANGSVLIALGGGSVIDAAKGMAALCALNLDSDAMLAHLREGRPLPDTLNAPALIAVPTTSGTGSEVTQWGTIWGEEGIKHSVTHPSLYPENAILDVSLCLSMPVDLTRATGLDALSHAMEAVWNRRHTVTTDALAEQAIRMVRLALPAAMRNPADADSRERMLTASTIAGLAMGTTQTAIAHSISYPFTARFGVPHGLACSFTLAEIVRFNIEEDRARLAPIARGFDCALDALPETVEVFLVSLGVGSAMAQYVEPADVAGFQDNLLTRARAANNIRDIDASGAKDIARRALERLNAGGAT